MIYGRPLMAFLQSRDVAHPLRAATDPLRKPWKEFAAHLLSATIQVFFLQNYNAVAMGPTL